MEMDALNFSIAVDEHMAALWEPLVPHHNILTPTRPREISNCITISKPVIATISHWLSDKTQCVAAPETYAAFDAIPEIC
jgi:hypothetical protein